MNDKKTEINHTMEVAEKAEISKQELNDEQLDDVSGGRSIPRKVWSEKECNRTFR